MSSREEVKNRLQRVFREVFGDESLVLRDDMTAADVPDWDSLNHINLVVGAERSFKVTLTTKEVTALRNVGQFIDLLLSKLP